jgi:hypothetical protein
MYTCPFASLIKHHVWRSGGISPPKLTSAVDGGEWSASHTGPYTPRETAAGTHWVGGWLGPRLGLEAVEKKESLAPVGNRKPAVQPVARRYTY